MLLMFMLFAKGGRSLEVALSTILAWWEKCNNRNKFRIKIFGKGMYKEFGMD
jgi:hypothetical protein